MIRRLFLSVLGVCLAAVSWAQLNVGEYTNSVIEYSTELQRAAAAVEGAEADMRVARKGFLPSVDMSCDATYDFRRSGDERRVSWSMRADVVQPIFYGGGVRARSEREEMLWNAAMSDQQSAALDVVYDAEVAYWTLSRAEIYCRAIERYYDIVRSLRDVAEHRFAEGYTSKSDLLQVESRLGDAQYQLSRARQQREQALHNFNTLRGCAPSCDVFLSQSILDTMQMPMREDVMEVIATHPDYVGEVAQREAKRWGVKVARADYLPKIGVNVYCLWAPNVPNIRGAGTRLDGGVVVSMSTPIFHFGERREVVRSARSVLRSAELSVEDVRDEITLNESDCWTNLLSTKERVEAIGRNLDLATENLEISTYSYGEGLGTILDVLQAQLSWLQIYSNAIAAQYDYAIAIAAYRYIVAR